ncbi:oleate hydratase [Paenibacillus sp. J23TS9]|uniref:oleate hydratase n=1 Tax=Paenibacillus sp. J23TS9 TaxID=2807193 RepID=UPI001B27824C|nr:oleate hydratase [Paenibacillus sp. J23TS9]GIP30101.1 oleate hydratase [Paenibacillus sp. J23TS9]
MLNQEKCNAHERKAYFIGGGIASLAGAVFLIRDGGMDGRNIHILEDLGINGGALDGIGSGNQDYVIRGGRMLNEPTYECTWNLLADIPSIDRPGKSVKDEIHDFTAQYPTHAKARLIDRTRQIVDVKHMGFSNEDRLDISKLLIESEEDLGAKRINEWFSEHFFSTNFWYMWATMFAFQPWHSAVEFKRYMIRFMHEFHRIDTLAGVARTPYNQYDSIVLPIQKWLEKQGVQYSLNTTVTDIDFAGDGSLRTAERIHYRQANHTGEILVSPEDMVFFTNGSMTENSDLGGMDRAPVLKDKGPSFGLWDKLSAKQPGFGNPAAFSNNITQSKWESFTVTCRNPLFFRRMEEFTGNEAGTGALVTFKDSNWLMSVVLAHQPHFRNQPDDIQVFWGYGLTGDRKGNYVDKTMAECTGAEILTELCGHLRFMDDLPLLLETSDVIPCMMPFITSQFMPRVKGDRPDVVPEGSTNFAFLGQYTEIPEDVVFTVEYSVRSAMTAVYKLLNIEKDIPQPYKGQHSPKVLFESLVTALR